MNRLMIPVIVSTIVLASGAHAQSGGASGSTTGDAQSTMQNGTTEASAQVQANADAQADLRALADRVRDKGSKVSAKARAKAEAAMSAAAKRVDEEASKGESRVAGRLAKEFDVPAQAITDEKAQLAASWGELTIAHTLAANSKGDIAAEQLLALHHDGMGWGQIAAGLGLQLGEAVSAVRSEGRVAMGEVKADGKVAAIHGEGARIGLDAGSKAGIAATRGTSVSAGVGAGVSVRAGK